MEEQKTKHMNYRGFSCVVNKAIGYAPYFTNMLLYRIHKKLATNVVIVGEAGIGKSYMANDIARVVEGKTKQGKDRFSLDQVVFTYKDFMNAVLKLKTGKIIIFDEPSYSMGKREWYKELNKALVQTVESFRFKVHPLFIPIINKSLLDKTIRSHLIQYQVTMQDRGFASVYRLKASQFRDEVYHHYFCELKYHLFDSHLCDRDTCLGCPKLSTCNIFRARYERKKASIQESRYTQARELADKIETKQLTMKQIENLALTIKDKFITEGKIDVQRLRILLQDDFGVVLSNTRGYKLKAMLEVHHPQLLTV